MLSRFRNKPNLKFLEIGCFEGQATTWMLEHILTDQSARIDVVDTFEGSPEHSTIPGIISKLRQTFEDNIRPYASHVSIHQGRSHDVLPIFEIKPTFDFIYIDGSHHQDDVYLDAVLSWPLLKENGVLGFDDYKWEWKDSKSGESQIPRLGIDRFLAEHSGEYALIHKRWQLFIVKKRVGTLEQKVRSIRWNAIFSKLPPRRSQFRSLYRRFTKTQ